MEDSGTKMLKQHAEYTHKFNTRTGRHGWLRLTPAYSLKVVEEIISPLEHPSRILDPFCGTATTALSAAYNGHEAVTTDINPFLVWLGRAKSAIYCKKSIENALEDSRAILSDVSQNSVDPLDAPPIHNIERWWSEQDLEFLCRLQAGIDARHPQSTEIGDLLRIAFCRTLISCSNAAFNHQSMSFQRSEQAKLDLGLRLDEMFLDHIEFVLDGASQNPPGEATILLHDARNLSALNQGLFDLVITSPPYANRMSYIRELRPYMYWLRFLTNSRGAGELDWQAIGGTWGIATSRLSQWRAEENGRSDSGIDDILARIAGPDNANGELLATYVRKYCTDMRQHFSELSTVVSPGAEVHYIVGNSMFYGVLVSVEQVYARFLGEMGFSDIKVRPIRKRNSKKALIEFDVSARWI